MGMFDDLIPQGGSQPQAQPAVSPEEDVITSTMRGIGQGATLGQAPNIGGAINYALHGGAEGSFDEGYNRSQAASQQSQQQHPDAYSVGNVAGGAATMAVPGGIATRVAAKTPALAGQLIRYGLNAMGWGKGVKAIDTAMEVAPHLAKVVRAEQQAAAPAETIGPNLSQAIRTGKFRTEGAPKGRAPRPAPNARMRPLSPEMQAKSDAYQAFLRRHSLNQ